MNYLNEEFVSHTDLQMEKRRPITGVGRRGECVCVLVRWIPG